MKFVRFNAADIFGPHAEKRTVMLIAILRSLVEKKTQLFRVTHYKTQDLKSNTEREAITECHIVGALMDNDDEPQRLVIAVPLHQIHKIGAKVIAIEIIDGITGEIYFLHKLSAPYKNLYANDISIRTTIEEPPPPRPVSPVETPSAPTTSTFSNRLKNLIHSSAPTTVDERVPTAPSKPSLPEHTSYITYPSDKTVPLVPFWYDRKHWEALNDNLFLIEADATVFALWRYLLDWERCKCHWLSHVFSSLEITPINEDVLSMVRKPLPTEIENLLLELWTARSSDVLNHILSSVCFAMVERVIRSDRIKLYTYKVDAGKTYTCSRLVNGFPMGEEWWNNALDFDFLRHVRTTYGIVKDPCPFDRDFGPYFTRALNPDRYRTPYEALISNGHIILDQWGDGESIEEYFTDVMDEQMEEILKHIDFLKEPEQLSKLTSLLLQQVPVRIKLTNGPSCLISSPLLGNGSVLMSRRKSDTALNKEHVTLVDNIRTNLHAYRN
jgi:hypothetical protein